MSEVEFATAQLAADELKAAIGAMRVQKAQLIEARRVLVAQENAIYLQPLSLADIKQFIFDYIDKIAAQYPEQGEWDKLIKDIAYPKRNVDIQANHGILSPSICLRDAELVMSDEVAFREIFGSPSLGFFNGFLIGQGVTSASFFFFGDLIKAKIGAYLDERYSNEDAPFSAAGAPAIERYSAIEQIDTEVAAITAQIKQIADQIDQVRFPDGGGQVLSSAAKRAEIDG